LIIALAGCSSLFAQTAESVSNGSARTLLRTVIFDRLGFLSCKNFLDIGVGYGVDYGGLLGIKASFIASPRLSVFVGGGSADKTMHHPGWNAGVAAHLLPRDSKYRIRPNFKVMYGINGVTLCEEVPLYDKRFTGLTPGFGVELRMGDRGTSGIDVGLNFPMRSSDFKNQIILIKNDDKVESVKEPRTMEVSVGIHHEFSRGRLR